MYISDLYFVLVAKDNFLSVLRKVRTNSRDSHLVACLVKYKGVSVVQIHVKFCIRWYSFMVPLVDNTYCKVL